MTPRLFISYRRASWSFTYWLAEELYKLIDADIFVDYSGIDETDFEQSLLRNLRESDAVVLVVSEYTFEARIHKDNDWVRREIREALGSNKPIALALVNEFIPPADIPDDIQLIRGKQGIEFYPRYFKAGVQELAAFLDRATPIKLRQAIGIPIKKAAEGQQAEQRRWEAGDLYDKLALGFSAAPEKVISAYTNFRKQYPEFVQDPLGLTTMIEALRPQQKPEPVGMVMLGESNFTLPMLEWINIPSGKVTLENNAYTVKSFSIAKYPVTNAQFQAFIDDGGYLEHRYWNGLTKRVTTPGVPGWSDLTHPRETVNWYEAIAFTHWLSEKMSLSVTLPSEVQWQRAALGNKNGIMFPYGNRFDKNKANTKESEINKTTPVDQYPQGVSSLGVMDLSGNVWEWCLSEDRTLQSAKVSIQELPVIRGGSWLSFQSFARATYRRNLNPASRFNDLGFRVVVTYPDTE